MMGRTRRSRAWRGAPAGLSVVMLLGGMVGSAGAEQTVTTAELGGQWRAPFEEGGATTPRCVAQESDNTIRCKPAAQGANVLRNGRVFYWNGFESQEEVSRNFGQDEGDLVRDASSRVLDVTSGTPTWITPGPSSRGVESNPDIQPGHKNEDDALGMLGVPGQPGDGFVGSTWGMAGLPPSNSQSPPDDAPHNDNDMFCGDSTQLTNGKILIAGGTDWYDEPTDEGPTELGGIKTTRLFDPDTNTFSAGGSMKFARWYPSMVGLADGKVMIVGGEQKVVKQTQLGQVRRNETYDPATNSWTENFVGPHSETSLPLQPRIHLVPNGKVLYNGVGQFWGNGGIAADEALFALQQMFDPATNEWEMVGLAPLGARNGAFEVMLPLKPPYDAASILTFGGQLGNAPGTYVGEVPFSTLTTVDQAGNVQNEMTGNLHQPKWFPSGVLMPDGKVITVGGVQRDEVIFPGTTSPLYDTEVYDPETGEWTVMNTYSRVRGYHHTAVLLGDMRVLLGGHAPTNTMFGPRGTLGPGFTVNETDPSFEVYSPPYLFRGARPSISSAPAGVAFGQSFTVGTPQANDIESVALLRLPSPQHVNDSDQRMLYLDFAKGNGSVQASAPPSGNVAPPGYYYLVVNKASPEGPIPSVARIVKVGEAMSGEAPQPFPDDAPGVQSGSATDLLEPRPAPPQNWDNPLTDAPLESKLPAGTPAPVTEAVAAAPVSTVASNPVQEVAALPARSTRSLPVPLTPLAVLAVGGLFGTAVGRRLFRLRGRT